MNDIPQYQIRIHQRAQKELASVTGDPGDELLERLRELKYYEEPTSAKYAKQMEDHQGLFAVRVDGYRALATLRKPAILILLIDTRSRVYGRIDTAKERGGLD